jgi:hypothetical protein
MHSYFSRKARGPHLRFTEGAGLGLPIIGKLLGHAQASTTARYAHLDAETLRLPAFPRETGPILAWPPPPAPVLVSSFVLPGPGPDWHAELRARDAARHEESLRVTRLRALAGGGWGKAGAEDAFRSLPSGQHETVRPSPLYDEKGAW